MRKASHTLAWAALVFVVLFWRLGAPSFWDPDEAHYAETTRELLETGDWATPYYNEQPFFDKPILFHLLQALPMVVLGPTELAARLAPAVAALALILTTAWLGATLVSADVGLVAGLLLTVSPAVFALSRYAILDTVFTSFLFGGLSLITVAAVKDRPRLQYAGYALIGLSVLTKGPLGLALSALALGLAIIVSADARRRLLGLRWATGLILVIAVASPWFLYMLRRFNGAFIEGYFLNENLRLFGQARYANQPPWWFYFQILAAFLLPWTALLIGRLVDDVRRLIRGIRPDAFEILLWSWAVAVVGFFTFSQFKLDHYVFPAAPALCLLCARAWADIRQAPDDPANRSARVGLHLIGPILVAVGAGCGYFIIARLDLPRAAIAVPAVMVLAGAAIAVLANLWLDRPPRVPWIAITVMGMTYAGIIFWVMPALEHRKVVPDVARWTSQQALPADRVATYRLNRWNTAFRFYVERHVELLETSEDAKVFFERPESFFCAMLRPAYEEFVTAGVPLRVVYEREGLWATSGRALWRRRATAVRFVVVTRDSELPP